jgi:hypothetical protein
MKKLLALLLLAPGMLAAQTSFDGTWIAKTDTAKFPEKPEQYVLDKGMYHCSTCVPKMDIKADGQDHWRGKDYRTRLQGRVSGFAVSAFAFPFVERFSVLVLAGFVASDPVVTSLAGFAGGRRPHIRGGRTPIPAAFR